jgi:hypothetical protein
MAFEAFVTEVIAKIRSLFDPKNGGNKPRGGYQGISGADDKPVGSYQGISGAVDKPVGGYQGNDNTGDRPVG